MFIYLFSQTKFANLVDPSFAINEFLNILRVRNNLNISLFHKQEGITKYNQETGRRVTLVRLKGDEAKCLKEFHKRKIGHMYKPMAFNVSYPPMHCFIKCRPYNDDLLEEWLRDERCDYDF